jgi:hypothetical protein
MDYESVKDYFDGFLLKKPQGKNIEAYLLSAIYRRLIFFIPFRASFFSQSSGKIIDGKITIGNGWASDAGI